MTDDTDLECGWILMSDVSVEDDDESAVALLRMSAYPIDPGSGRMRCPRNGAIWHLGGAPQGGSRRPSPLQRGELRGYLEWESGEKSLVVGDMLLPDREATEYVTYSSDLHNMEACQSCGKMTSATHTIRIRAGELKYSMVLLCAYCGHDATAEGRTVPDDIKAALSARDGIVEIHADLAQLAVLPAALSGAAEVTLEDARERVKEARVGAPLFVGPSYAAEVVAQRLENAGVVVRRVAK